MLLSLHVTSVLFLVCFNNSTLTMGFYWSYTLLLQSSILMRSWYMCMLVCVCKCTWICMLVCVWFCACVRPCVHVCVYIYMCVLASSISLELLATLQRNDQNVIKCKKRCLFSTLNYHIQFVDINSLPLWFPVCNLAAVK